VNPANKSLPLSVDDSQNLASIVWLDMPDVASVVPNHGTSNFFIISSIDSVIGSSIPDCFNLLGKKSDQLFDQGIHQKADSHSHTITTTIVVMRWHSPINTDSTLFLKADCTSELAACIFKANSEVELAICISLFG
jgi:hypothetical protein